MATRSPYVIIAAAALAALAVSAASGAATPAELRPVGSFSAPIGVAVPLHEDHLVFVVERAGRVRVVRDGTALAQPFLDIGSLVSTAGEGGLLSLSFAPRYWQTGRFIVVYTDLAGSIQITEYRRSLSNPELADPLSARAIVTIPHPIFTNHYGGSSAFGPDGLLYVGTGDGGGGGDQLGNAQNLGSLLGKLLRIDPFGANPYAIPAGNPFVGISGARPEIFAYGLRNPWRFAFDRATGDLLIGDVGQAEREEVDFVRAPVPGGLNFGWNVYEGSRVFGPGSAPGAVFPIFEYAHDGTVCSITGGLVVRDPGLPALLGRYVYGDWCGGELHSLTPALPLATDDADTGLNVPQLVSFGEDAGGCVYAVSLVGTVYRLAAVGAAAPVPCADVPPETTISSAPPSPVSGPASFEFSSSEPGSSFECRIDGGAWDPCSSARVYTLPPGSHLFETRATDPGGTTDPTPAQAPFTVVGTGGSAPEPPPPPVAVPAPMPPDLAVSLATTAQQTEVGKAMTYLATVTNRGLGSSSATVTFSLPANTTFVSSTVDGRPGCSQSGQTVICPLGLVVPGAVSQVRVSLIPRSPGTLVCSVAVSSVPSDAAPGDNAASLTLRLAATERTGTARADTLIGTAGNDVLRGLGGNDRLDGRAGRDTLYGGSGDDRLTGGADADTVFGGTGSDVVRVRGGGRDLVDCGPGHDTLFADRGDAAPHRCEIVRRGPG